MSFESSKYFYRTAAFSKQGDQVKLVDVLNVEEGTPALEPWLGLVVSLADGRHQLQELVAYMAQHYGQAPPPNLQETIESVVERLVETEVIKLADEQVELPYYLTLPVERLDLEKARRLIEKGGD